MKNTFHCKQCRSEDVHFYATAIWDWESQDMMLEYVADDHVAVCRACNSEVETVMRTNDGLPLSELDLYDDEVFSEHLRLSMAARDAAPRDLESGQAKTTGSGP